LYAAALKFRRLAEPAQGLSGGSTLADGEGFGLGDEAIVAGATLELGPEDTIVAALPTSAARVIKGAAFGYVLAPVDGTEGSAKPPFPAACDPFNLGTGLALVHRLEKKGNVVVVLCMEDASTCDRWHEAMKFAGIHKLPIIYVLKSGSALGPGPRDSTPALEDVSFMTRDGAFPAVIVDSNDAVGVWRVAYESIHRARNGSGPTLIECDTQFARSGDPLAVMEHYMRKRGAWDDKWSREIANAIEGEIAAKPLQGAFVS
jgi:TPP-dependent pyruvate/acetoin dehydrogenase alpha subunit